MEPANADNAARPASTGPAVEGEIRDLIRSEVLSGRKTEATASSAAPSGTSFDSGGDTMTPLIRRIGDASIAEIDRLIAELQAARNYLQAEGDRIQRETARYAHLSQTASASVKVISESLSEWRKAGRPERERERFAPAAPAGAAEASSRS